ncbi:MAG: peptidoglycan-binding protein [Patescibacteria group bacterium]
MNTFLTRALSVLLISVIAALTGAPTLDAAVRRGAFEETASVRDLAAAYQSAASGGERVRILIMPGHEPNFGGAQFKGFYERELVVDIAERLAGELRSDPSFEVLVARGNEGWNRDLTRYFDREEDEIEEFVEDQKEDMEKLEDRGGIDEQEEQAEHNKAPEDVALRLYGVNKWANENDVDLVLHLHLNDETGHGDSEPGIHSGSAIYVPDPVFGNAKASKAVAQPIFERLQATNATSTFGLETKGIVEDRDLIAIGANNTAEIASILIEYGYIYEPRITEGAREQVFADYAYQTALGVKDFFGVTMEPSYETRALPFTFASDILAAIPVATSTSTATGTPAYDTRAVYTLQAKLHDLGFYPGSEASLAVCPIGGLANVCLPDAVKAFQLSRGLEQTGTLGPRTRALLNADAPAVPLAQQAVTPAPSPSPAPAAAPATAAVAPVPDPIAACTTLSGTLELDATDETTDGDVTRLQTILAKDVAVYPERSVTGYFGPATLAAVKRFQLKEAIVPATSAGYGLVGPATKAALAAACSAS